MFERVRPQIFLALLLLGILAAIGAWKGMPELATANIGGIIALGMKVLEAECLSLNASITWRLLFRA